AGDVPGFFAAVESAAGDTAVLERTRRLAVVAGTFGWDDIGSWDALLRVRPTDRRGNVVVGRATLDDDVRRSVVWVEADQLAVSGMQDVIVVRANGRLLVMPTGHAERLKTLVPQL
ncbi:MAG: mannose-1-phosphate guanylyltransferase, partial [Gemmatimonadales bacterium]